MKSFNLTSASFALSAIILVAGCVSRNPDTALQAQAINAGGDKPLPATSHQISMKAVEAAQKFRSDAQPVQAQDESTLIAEAEEFQPAKSETAWRALSYGTNMYAATFANTFLSRHAYLSAPEQSDGATATITVNVPKAGQYLALVRYEAVPGFETQFRLNVEQGGQTRLNRLYGARDNLKIWAFGQKLQKEVSWDWGAVENVVWEGHDATVNLQAGTARLILFADKQTTPAARRNVDLIMLTSDLEQVKHRIENEGYLPLDGMLTQSGDVHLKVTNRGAGALTLTVPNGIEHSPYWVHERNWKPKTMEVAAGQTTDWHEVGSLLDSLNDGQWKLKATGDSSSYSLEFGVRDATGKIGSIRRFENLNGDVELAYGANTRYTRHIGTSADVLYELVDWLKKQPIRGQAPKSTLIYGYTFDPRPSDAKYMAAREEFMRLTGLNALTDSAVVPQDGVVRGYVDLRSGVGDLTLLEEELKKLQAAGTSGRIAVVSLGDEIGLPEPPANAPGFAHWLKQQGGAANQVASAEWSVSNETKKNNPALFYFSSLYQRHYGIEKIKAATDLIKRYLPNAGIGANFSPHHAPPYLGETHKFVTLFRKEGMTLPWSEDYIWQVPVGSQQMNFLNVDLFRSGIKDKPNAKIHMYVMPHWPGNTPDGWRRQFYGNIAHGTKQFNLFEFRPVQAAYTENHVTLPQMYQEVRRGLYELGTFEDILQNSKVLPAQTALWFSETGDIWENNRSPFGAAKRTLYIAIRHQQLPLDMVIDGDDLKSYRVLYLADQNVSRAASQRIAEWVRNGGQLFATAGAGMFDETNRPNSILREVLGVEQQNIVESEAPIRWAKQDLPFAKTIATVKWKDAELPAFGARSHISVKGAQVQANFSDGSPAVTSHKFGEGSATYTAFLPGLSYFKPAIPQRPVDRGSSDDSMAHFIPTAFDKTASQLIAIPAAGIACPVKASEPLVETSILQAQQGVLVPLVNWSSKPVNDLTVTLPANLPSKSVALASGREVKIKRENEQTTVTFDLDVADALVLR